MGSPYVGEIRIFSFGFPPSGWALCDGQLLPIHQNQALFSILGTTYGGDGRVTFALPDLEGRVPVHTGNNITLGQVGGEQSHTLNISELPAHENLTPYLVLNFCIALQGIFPSQKKGFSAGANGQAHAQNGYQHYTFPPWEDEIYVKRTAGDFGAYKSNVDIRRLI